MNTIIFLFDVRFVFAELEGDSLNDFLYTNLNDVGITNLDWFLGVFTEDLQLKHRAYWLENVQASAPRGIYSDP